MAPFGHSSPHRPADLALPHVAPRIERFAAGGRQNGLHGQSEENLSNDTQGMLTAFRGIGKGDITQDASIWKMRGVMAGKSSPILVDGRVYQSDDQNNLYMSMRPKAN